MTGNPEVMRTGPFLRIAVAVGTTIADRPPAQIRTGAFTHTALTVEEWRQNVLLAAHRAIPGTCASRSVSDACEMERCSPQSVPFPPQPPRNLLSLCWEEWVVTVYGGG